jgi:hypothetical protein
MSFRYERKYLIPEDHKKRLNALLSVHPAGFCQAYPPRRVNSIYFDDPACTNWVHSEEGFFDRKKIRIRWYGPLQGEITEPRLEIKSKQGHLGSKDVFGLPSFILGKILDVQEIVTLIRQAGIPERIQNMMRLYTPSLLNSYHRRYLLSADHHFRLTIDEDMTYFALTSKRMHLGSGLKDPVTTLLELKYDHTLDPYAPAITNHWPYRQTRKSKYATGMNLTRFVGF